MREPLATTYRLRNVPRDFDRGQVQELVRRTLGLSEDVVIDVKSLAENPYPRENQVATIVFSSAPELFLKQGEQDEWKIEEHDHNSQIRRSNSLIFDTHFKGFTPFHVERDADCRIDLIAVSGLGGHAFGSFKERSGSYMWLRDSLPYDLPNVRIFIYGYDSSLANSTSFQDTHDLGKQLRSSISAIRHSSKGSEQARPLLLIGHSLGGILIKQALIELCYDDSVQQDDLKLVSGIVLFGVPSQGMSIESLIPMVENQPNRFLLESLGRTSAVLKDQTRIFSEKFDYPDTRIISFYETMTSPTAIKIGIRWAMSGPAAILVDQHSATHHRIGEANTSTTIPLNRTHSDMVKFLEQDNDYAIVLYHLSNLVKNAPAVVESRFKGESSHIPRHPTLQQNECLRSLSFIEQDFRRHKIVSVEDSCRWLLEHDVYQHWLQEYHGLLWIKGKPGAGKSTLMKYATSDCESRYRGGEVIVMSFFFNARGAEIEKSPLGLIRSLLHQLLDHSAEQLDKLTFTFEKRCRDRGRFGEKWNWSYEELKEFLSDALLEVSLRHPIYAYVDALDESGESNAVEITELFQRLVLVAESTQGHLNICFSCRHYPIIVYDTGSSICVEDENQNDIRAYVEHKLTKVFSESNLHMLMELILRKANGVFQWVALVIPQLQALRRKGKTFQHIQSSLSKIPSDLSALYADLLSAIDTDDKHKSVKLLQWICFALRSLTVRELQHAVMMDVYQQFNSVAEYQESDDFADNEEDMERIIIDLTKGLAEVKVYNGNRTVQLIHQSVSDYLIETGFATLQAMTPLNATCAGHFRLSRSCIQYLALADRHQWTQSLDNAYKTYPLLYYASRMWSSHARLLENDGIAQDDLPGALRWRTDDVIENWLLIMRELSFKDRDVDAQFIIFLCQKGLSSVLMAMISTDPILKNLEDIQGRTALSWTAFFGTWQTTQSLLAQDGIDASKQDESGKTPLSIAAQYGHLKVAEILLAHNKTDLNISDDLGQTPISLAAKFGHLQVVKLLCEQVGIDFNKPNGYGRTPIAFAGQFGWQEVVELLVKQDNIQINKSDQYGQTPLSLAVEHGRILCVQILLNQSGIEVNTLNYRGRSPLCFAAEYGDLFIVELLLRHPNIDLEILDKHGLTPLDWAERKQHDTIASLIREKLYRDTGYEYI